MHPELIALGSKEYVGLEAFDCPAVAEVTLTSDELTALCPMTGQPDLYEVKISYYPEGRCLESKSVKLYLASFRNEGVFCEDLAVRIKGDIVEALGIEDAVGVSVRLTQKSRGGISIAARA